MTEPLTVRYAPSGIRATLEVGGKDVTNYVTRMTIDHSALALPKVYLELSPKAELDEVLTEAMVHIREVVQEDPADAMLRFIEPLDPGEFERACLELMELGGPQTFGAAALAVLRAYAGGVE